MPDAVTLDRCLPLEGAQNFRDIGGYRAMDGRSVRWRRVFRSAALHDLTARDVETLASLGTADVFDLRTTRELEHFGTNPLGARGARHHHVPFVPEVGRDVHREAAPARPVDPFDPRPTAEGYLWMLEHGGAAVSRVLRHLADDPPGATIFHCTAGKDRTGVVAALLLAALGVDEGTIFDDYALTAQHLFFDDAAAARFAAFYGMPARSGPAIANPETMRLTFEGLAVRHGSALGYLASVGVGETELAALRASLLEG